MRQPLKSPFGSQGVGGALAHRLVGCGEICCFQAFTHQEGRRGIEGDGIVHHRRQHRHLAVYESWGTPRFSQ